MNSQKEKLLISVIVPTHNRLGMLQEALDTVYAQEGVGELFEMEVIVVDDTPSDATRRAMSRYPGVQYIPLETNVFVSTARNVGIKASKGEYVALLDDDDLWVPHRLKAHVPVLETRPDVGVVYGQVLVKDYGPAHLWPDALHAPSGSVFRACLMREWVLPHCVMIRRDAFEKAGYFDENLRTMEHYDMFLRLAFHVPFAFIPGAVAIGRFSENGKWFTNVKSGGFERAVQYIVDRALNMLPDTPERTELRRQADSSWLSQLINLLEKAGQTDQMRSHVLTALKRSPWMMTESWALAVTAENVSRVASRIALSSESPITTVRTFCTEIRASVDACKLREWLRLKWLLAYVWMAVGRALKRTDSPLQRRPAGYAAFYAALHNPVKLRRKALWRLMIRGILASPHWDPIIAIFRKKNAD